MTYKKDAKLFKALSDENRLHILCQLSRTEKCACVLFDTLNISQPTLSHHMRILVEAGLVVGRKEGKWMHYSLSKEAHAMVQDLLNKYLTTL